jgi:methylated-DNA-[protein]-cysteine S-methyltransferase
MSSFSFATIDSPVGRLELVSNGEALERLAIEGPEYPLQHGGRAGQPDAVIAQATGELAEYFAGTRRTFDVPVKLVGTAFQQAIWHELATLGFGETIGYAQLAARAGNPHAARAVGGAVGANPVAIIIPCHRVIAANGKLTGYSNGSGLETKIQLLKLEGIWVEI